MYSVEYKCTKEETPETTISIVVDKGSKQKLQSMISSSECSHGATSILQLDPIIAVS
jgi:hypothetical protein